MLLASKANEDNPFCLRRSMKMDEEERKMKSGFPNGVGNNVREQCRRLTVTKRMYETDFSFKMLEAKRGSVNGEGNQANGFNVWNILEHSKQSTIPKWFWNGPDTKVADQYLLSRCYHSCSFDGLCLLCHNSMKLRMMILIEIIRNIEKYDSCFAIRYFKNKPPVDSQVELCIYLNTDVPQNYY